MARLISAFRDAGVRFTRDGCAFHAQSVAYNALFALFPLTVLALGALTLVLPEAQHRTLLFFDTLAPTLHDFIVNNLQTYIYGRGISSLIALAFLVWSGKNLFMGLAYALDRALNVPKARPLVHNLLLSAVMLPVTGILLAIAIGLPIVLSITFHVAGLEDPARITHILAYLVSIALVFIVAVVLYRFLPNTPRDVALRVARRRGGGGRMADRPDRVRPVPDERELRVCLRRALGATRLAALVLLHRLDLLVRGRIQHRLADRIFALRSRRIGA